jgi:hypothetical protein
MSVTHKTKHRTRYRTDNLHRISWQLSNMLGITTYISFMSPNAAHTGLMRNLRPGIRVTQDVTVNFSPDKGLCFSVTQRMLESYSHLVPVVAFSDGVTGYDPCVSPLPDEVQVGNSLWDS